MLKEAKNITYIFRWYWSNFVLKALEYELTLLILILSDSILSF